MGTTPRIMKQRVGEGMNISPRFDFFQAVRLMEALSEPHARPVGYHHRMQDEGVHFKTEASLRFPTQDIAAITFSKDGPISRYIMTVTFMGLFGQTGILPEYYTELISSLEKEKNIALKEFLNLFNHRFISLYYRAWERNNIYLSYARQAQPDMVKPAVTSEPAFNTQAVLLYYSGLFSQYPRNTSNLEKLLRDYFQLPIEVFGHQRVSYPLPISERSRLSQGFHKNTLGRDLFLGAQFQSFQSKIKIVVGPLHYKPFNDLLPTGTTLKSIVKLAQLYLTKDVVFDIQLVLLQDEVPSLVLEHKPARARRLGWNTWLIRKMPIQPKRDIVFRSHNFNSMLKEPHHGRT